MRPIGFVGVVLIVLGIGVLAVLGLSHTKDHDASYVGPVQVATITKGAGPPVVAMIALVAGVAMVAAGRRPPAE